MNRRSLLLALAGSLPGLDPCRSTAARCDARRDAAHRRHLARPARGRSLFDRNAGLRCSRPHAASALAAAVAGTGARAHYPGRRLADCRCRAPRPLVAAATRRGRVAARRALSMAPRSGTSPVMPLPAGTAGFCSPVKQTRVTIAASSACGMPRRSRNSQSGPAAESNRMTCRLDASGALIVANGGIRRAAGDRKRDLDRMESSVARLDTATGQLLGQWRLQDPRLSLRHLAWSHTMEGQPLLGIGLQAEHDDPARRSEAPVLALWDGAKLSIPTHATDADGYAGDICSAPLGGFLLSSNRTNSALWWRPDQPGRLWLVARLTEAYALGSHVSGRLTGWSADILRARRRALASGARPLAVALARSNGDGEPLACPGLRNFHGRRFRFAVPAHPLLDPSRQRRRRGPLDPADVRYRCSADIRTPDGGQRREPQPCGGLRGQPAPCNRRTRQRGTRGGRRCAAGLADHQCAGHGASCRFDRTRNSSAPQSLHGGHSRRCFGRIARLLPHH